MKDWMFLVIAAVFIWYVVIGGIVFTVLESGFEEKIRLHTKQYKQNWLNSHPTVQEADLDLFIEEIVASRERGIIASSKKIEEVTWNLPTSIYFVVTVITTIGYGNITPQTSSGKLFCVIFALLGIPFCLVLFTKIGYSMSNRIKSLDVWISLRMQCEVWQKYPTLRKLISYTFVYLLSTTLMLFIPALILTHMEHNWTYGDGLYYTFMTLTTVGFGDCVAGSHDKWGHPMYRILIAGWMIIGLSWMATCITSAQDLIDGMFQKLNTKEENIKNSPTSSVVKNNKLLTGGDVGLLAC